MGAIQSTLGGLIGEGDAPTRLQSIDALILCTNSVLLTASSLLASKILMLSVCFSTVPPGLVDPVFRSKLITVALPTLPPGTSPALGRGLAQR